jgi:hypothetical protein
LVQGFSRWPSTSGRGRPSQAPVRPSPRSEIAGHLQDILQPGYTNSQMRGEDCGGAFVVGSP